MAGLTVGQDISERTAQMAGTMPQFSLAKSYPGFAPTGPHLVTPDEMPDLDDVKLGTLVNGDVVQDGTTRNMIFTVPALIASLSAVCPFSRVTSSSPAPRTVSAWAAPHRPTCGPVTAHQPHRRDRNAPTEVPGRGNTKCPPARPRR